MSEKWYGQNALCAVPAKKWCGICRVCRLGAGAPGMDVVPAILSRDFVAQLYRATKSRDKIAGVTSV